MEIIESVEIMKHRSRKILKTGKTLGMVPTMGCLHEGHLSLVRCCVENCDITVVSIFINPAQFGKNEDLNNYPQSSSDDQNKLRELGVDILFLPSKKIIYPKGFQTFVTMGNITSRLCGKSRPSFFKGVATIILKLFNIIQPHKAFFGEKDRQQLEVIRTLTRDLNIDTEITGLPIIRDPDGLAMSSRNLYLSSKERQSAQSLYRALKTAQDLVKSGERSPQKVKQKIEGIILQEANTQIDYISICDPQTFSEIEKVKGKTLIALAVNIGKARLIDNCIVETNECKE